MIALRAAGMEGHCNRAILARASIAPFSDKNREVIERVFAIVENSKCYEKSRSYWPTTTNWAP